MTGDDDWKRGVKPLGGATPKRPGPVRARPEPTRAPVEFVVTEGEGRRLDVSRRQLATLRRGEWLGERDLDLHGLERNAARRELHAQIERAQSEGLRCLRVIHGRGLRSPGAPVLREGLSEWLQQEPSASRILAWAPEARSLGGSTLVLLRRLATDPTERSR